VTFYCTIGPAIIPELIYSDRVDGEVRLYFFRCTFNLTFRPNDSGIYAGINVIPVLYLLLFHREVGKAEKSENFELDLFKTRNPRPPDAKK
jgi:hypothetical protein